MSIKRITNYQKLVGSRVAAVLLSVLLFLPALNKAAAQCGDWDRVPTPNVGDKTNWLSAVSAFADNDAWAVGLWRDASGVFGPLAMRWNGTTWSLTDLPDTSFLGALPETAGVEAVSGGDVWVVGNVFVGVSLRQPSPRDVLAGRLVGLCRYGNVKATDGLSVWAPWRLVI